MITLFKADETIFSHDGVEVLDDIVISSYTSWSENGKWVSESKFKKDYDKSESIKEGMILQLPTEKGLQLFRILKLNKKNKKEQRKTKKERERVERERNEEDSKDFEKIAC
mgnify:CR=1 FL=1